MEKNIIFVNNYIPHYPVHNNILDDALLRNKYENINRNKEHYFENAKIINFDIINHQCRQEPLKNSVKYYQTIHEHNLQCAREEDQEEFISAAIRSKRDDLFIKRNIIIQHFKQTPELIRFKQKNKLLLSSMHGRKKQEEYNSKISLYSHLKINK